MDRSYRKAATNDRDMFVIDMAAIAPKTTSRRPYYHNVFSFLRGADKLPKSDGGH